MSDFTIMKIFNAEDITEMKNAIKQILIDKFKDDLDLYTSQYYCFEPKIIEKITTEGYKNAIDKLYPELLKLAKQKIKNAVIEIKVNDKVVQEIKL